jgi:dephospho-CoA kinase
MEMKRSLVIGLTGGIAAGKSTVARMFAELGAAVLDADDLSRLVAADQPEVLARLVEAFGASILDEQGRLHRGHLGRIVFSDDEARRRLEAITHPAIVTAARRRIEALRGEGHALIVYEAALLVESGRHREMDRVVVVTAEEEERLRRLCERNSLTRGEALDRLRAQLPQEIKAASADYLIDNSGPLEETRRQVVQVFRQLRREGPNGREEEET